MIDFHCHILPGLDDGARHIEESLEMALVLEGVGCTAVFATPHVMLGAFDNYADAVRSAVTSLAQVFAREGIRLSLVPASEVYIDPTIPQLVRDRRVCCLGDSPFLLVELPHGELPFYTETVFFQVMLLGVTPVIAHPERNHTLRRDPEKLAGWVARGMVAQVNAGSLCGVYGRSVQAAAENMCRRGLVALVGSDAHSSSQCELLGEAWERFQKLTRGTPETSGVVKKLGGGLGLK
ncbi:MAG: tyrosine-protein phosphatase [Bacillota bacterium]